MCMVSRIRPSRSSLRHFVPMCHPPSRVGVQWKSSGMVCRKIALIKFSARRVSERAKAETKWALSNCTTVLLPMRSACFISTLKTADSQSFQLITYEALGLCGRGEAHKMVERGDNTVGYSLICTPCLTPSIQYGGKYVVNPSGGLEAKGHPLGATGIGMHFYITSEWGIHETPRSDHSRADAVQLRDCEYPCIFPLCTRCKLSGSH